MESPIFFFYFLLLFAIIFHMITQKKASISKLLWDLWCLVSLVGIWPRYIEPRLITLKSLKIPLENIPREIEALKIVQFSDLHFSHAVSDRFLNRIAKKILKQKPDLILFTGDFLCYSNLEGEEQQKRLRNFLNQLKAPLGSYAVLGNHDYERFVSVNETGEYDLIEDRSSTLKKGFKRLFSKITLQKRVTERASKLKSHQKLLSLLKETPFKILENEHLVLRVGKAKLNLVGLGEYTLGKTLPEKAFKGLDERLTTVVLTHNPDSFSLLKKYRSDLILSGHTHGGQINLPGFREKFTLVENSALVRGLVIEESKKIYINRGLGSVMKFRFCARPEILLFSFENKKEAK